jgi:hypothetical protein
MVQERPDGCCPTFRRVVQVFVCPVLLETVIVYVCEKLGETLWEPTVETDPMFVMEAFVALDEFHESVAESP